MAVLLSANITPLVSVDFIGKKNQVILESYIYYLMSTECFAHMPEYTYIYSYQKIKGSLIHQSVSSICIGTVLVLKTFTFLSYPILHPTFNIQHPKFYIQHPTSYILHSTSYIQHHKSYIQHPTQKVYPIQSYPILSYSILSNKNI